MSVHRALARVNVAAIERNCARLCRELRPGVQLCAVVKADGYGHGAPASARAALAGGATWLAVAGGGEALELRSACVGEARLLVADPARLLTTTRNALPESPVVVAGVV